MDYEVAYKTAEMVVTSVNDLGRDNAKWRVWTKSGRWVVEGFWPPKEGDSVEFLMDRKHNVVGWTKYELGQAVESARIEDGWEFSR